MKKLVLVGLAILMPMPAATVMAQHGGGGHGGGGSRGSVDDIKTVLSDDPPRPRVFPPESALSQPKNPSAMAPPEPQT